MMKCCSVAKSRSQSTASLERSISSVVQKEALAFLYILQMSSCWEENEAMRVRLEERLRSEGAFTFGILVVRDLRFDGGGVFTVFLVVEG